MNLKQAEIAINKLIGIALVILAILIGAILIGMFSKKLTELISKIKEIFSLIILIRTKKSELSIEVIILITIGLLALLAISVFLAPKIPKIAKEIMNSLS